MSMAEEEQTDMHRQVRQFAAALSSFSSAPDTFRVLLGATPPAPAPAPAPPPSTLYVLDSSFNPPTRAHLRIAASALLHDRGPPPKRLLLLLATHNADKAPALPAPLEHRLALMALFARHVREACLESSSATSGGGVAGQEKEEEGGGGGGGGGEEEEDCHHGPPEVDIGLTKHPFFMDKAAAIAESGVYPRDVTQVHLTGYDTLIRILNPKYYPPSHTLAPLEPFLSKHRLRVTYRTDDDWGGRAEQDAYLKALKDGEMEAKGGKREWADSIMLVEGRRKGEDVISSTRVREAVKNGDRNILYKLVPEGVAHWVLNERLYANN